MKEKLVKFLEERIEEKWAYEVWDEWALDDIANDYCLDSYVVTNEWFEAEYCIEDWEYLIKEVCGIEIEVTYVDWIKYIGGKNYDDYITNFDDLFNVLQEVTKDFISL